MIASRFVRILCLVVLFAASVTGHEAAMAQASAMPDHGMMMAGHDHAGHQLRSASAECSGYHCETKNGPCCVMGQCLLAIPVSGAILFRLLEKIDQEPVPIRVIAQAEPDVPFRPPAPV